MCYAMCSSDGQQADNFIVSKRHMQWGTCLFAIDLVLEN